MELSVSQGGFMILGLLAFALAAQPSNWEPGGKTGWTQEGISAQADATRLHRLAKAGDARAMREYGLLLWQGRQVKRDREAALGWFYEAALRNDAPSMFMLGRAFERGEGVGRDLKLADYWVNRAIDYGFKIETDR
jgi:TPR repeat protein